MQFTIDIEDSFNADIEHYTAALEINLNDSNTYCSRGVAHYALGNLEQAIADYTKAIDLNPNYAIAYYHRGMTKANWELHESAIAVFDTGIRLEPGYAEAYLNPRDTAPCH